MELTRGHKALLVVFAIALSTCVLSWAYAGDSLETPRFVCADGVVYTDAGCYDLGMAASAMLRARSYGRTIGNHRHEFKHEISQHANIPAMCRKQFADNVEAILVATYRQALPDAGGSSDSDLNAWRQHVIDACRAAKGVAIDFHLD